MAPSFALEVETTRHQVYIELNEGDCDIEKVADHIDRSLSQRNPHFKKKRENGTIEKVEVLLLKKGAFTAYYESKKSVGAQVKMIRLYNDREVLNLFQSWVQTTQL